MEAHGPQPGALRGGLEALQYARAIEQASESWVAEHEIVVAGIQGGLVVLVEFSRNEIRERDSAAWAFGLGGAELAADVALADTDPACWPVDVAPGQPEQLPHPQSSHCGREIESSLGRLRPFFGLFSQDGVELVQI